MEIHQLRYFCAIVRTGSFTRAADQLGIAQPSLSQQIKRLEKNLGSALFERLGRSVRLTASGEGLHKMALGILQQVAEAESRIAALNEGYATLRIGVIPTIMPYFIARNIGDFTRRYPRVNLLFREETTSQLVQILQAGEIDLAVVSLPIPKADIVCSELFREELLLVVPRKHPLSGHPPVNLRDLRKERLLLLKEGHCLRDDVLTACTRAKAELRSVFETNQMESIFELVRSGFGLSVIPEMAVSHASGCALIRLHHKSYRRIGYIRARRHLVSKPMREFADWLRLLGKKQ
ncbi:MAG: LysR family transcriptional regulator [Terriglobales bacterium]|jgi:LysR family hydrogen peroxide-inducible transcriptional activator